SEAWHASGADRLLPGDTVHRRKQYCHHGGVARNGEQPPHASCDCGMGCQCLSSCLGSVHHHGGRSGGPIWGASFLGGRLCAVRSRIADDGRCTERNRGGGARALQGLGAAFAVAGTLAAATQAVPEAERAKAVGAWTGFLLLGFSIGPLVSGVVTPYAGYGVSVAHCQGWPYFRQDWCCGCIQERVVGRRSGSIGSVLGCWRSSWCCLPPDCTPWPTFVRR